MIETRHLSGFGDDLTRVAAWAHPHWNAGARFWLEHRAPAVGRAVRDLNGPVLWLSLAPPTRLPYLARLCSLMAEHVVIGHGGPLPPFHLGLMLPIPMGNRIPDPVPAPREGECFSRPLIVDGVRRPLPPLARRLLLGQERMPLREGVLSYLPASILFSPLPGEPWPDPGEVLRRPGDMPNALPGFRDMLALREAQARETPPPHLRTQGSQAPSNAPRQPLDPPTGPEVVFWRLHPEAIDSDSLGIPRPVPRYDRLFEEGFERYSDPRVYSDVWEHVPSAARWELNFATEIGADFLCDTFDHMHSISTAPAALLDLEVPYLATAPWDIILQLREDERDSLQLLRHTVRRACAEVSEARGSRDFQNAVRRIQETVLERGIKDVKKAVSGQSGESWGKFAGFAIAGLSLHIAVYLGMPEISAIAIGGGLAKSGIDLIVDIRRDGRERRRRAKGALPMYFIWMLGKRSTGRRPTRP